MDLRKYDDPRFKNGHYSEETGNNVWMNVSGDDVVKFLSLFEYPAASNYTFDHEAIIKLIHEKSSLSNWDVAIQHGTGYDLKSIESTGISTKTVVRSSYTVKSEDIIRIDRAAVMTPSNLKEGLYVECDSRYVLNTTEIKRMENIFDGENKKRKSASSVDKNAEYPSNVYLRTENRRPIMIIYPVDLSKKTSPSEEEQKIIDSIEETGCAPIAVVLGFPRYMSSSVSEKLIIPYRTSVVYKKMGGNDLLDEDDDVCECD